MTRIIRTRLGFLQALLSLALLGTAHTSLAEAHRYELDPDHLTIGFLISHLGYEDILGTFQKASGSYTFDESTRMLRDVRVIVETSSVYTGHEKRDGHVRSRDFLDAARAPQMIFTASSAAWSDDKTFQVDGELELLGKKHPLSLTGTVNKAGIYPIGPDPKPYVMGVSLRGTVKRSDWGMNYGVGNGMVGDDVDLIIEFEARRR